MKLKKNIIDINMTSFDSSFSKSNLARKKLGDRPLSPPILTVLKYDSNQRQGWKKPTESTIFGSIEICF